MLPCVPPVAMIEVVDTQETAERIFHEALTLTSDEERRACLDRACGDDRALRAEVDSLLLADAEAENFLNPTLAPAGDAAELRTDAIPGYELRGVIGSGGMGTVYRAFQHSLRRDVAIKVLSPALSRLETFRQSFEAEALAMARLSHPNLVGVHDYGAIDRHLYLVMELVEGQSLAEAAHGMRVDPVQAVEIVLAVAEGLAEAHHGGILHRDLKPANIFITPRLVSKLGDFGLAVPTGDAGSGIRMGTPGYMAPEVRLDHARATPSSDVYSLGVVLHELLTGCPPSASRIPDLESLPALRDLKLLLGRMLNVDPAHRIPDAVELTSVLRSWLTEARTVPPRLLTPHPDRSARRPIAHRLRAYSSSSYSTGSRTLTASAVALVGVLAAVLFLLQGREAPGRKEPINIGSEAAMLPQSSGRTEIARTTPEDWDRKRPDPVPADAAPPTPLEEPVVSRAAPLERGSWVGPAGEWELVGPGLEPVTLVIEADGSVLVRTRTTSFVDRFSLTAGGELTIVRSPSDPSRYWRLRASRNTMLGRDESNKSVLFRRR